ASRPSAQGRPADERQFSGEPRRRAAATAQTSRTASLRRNATARGTVLEGSKGKFKEPVGPAGYPAAMPTHLNADDHLQALVRSGTVLREAAAAAGPGAKVPTCPSWDVATLVTHQGTVHRWAAANLRGDKDHNPSASEAEAGAADDLPPWCGEGLAALGAP